MGGGKRPTASLARKNRGGVANFAGNTFEGHFAISRLALALSQLSRGDRSRVAMQLAGCHVDDWVEDTTAERRHFQLKRSATVGWSAVRADFEEELRSRARSKVTVVLVVPTSKRAAHLRKSNARVQGARVVSFPKALNPQDVMHLRPCSSALESLWAESKMTDTERRLLWFAIDEAWQTSRKPKKFVPVSRVFAEIPDRAIDLIRQSWIAPARWTAFEQLLSRVPGLSCRIEHGIFTYSGAGLDGRYSCRNPLLKKLMRRVLRKPPMTFTDFVELL